jgi:hypothetical protein
MTDDLKALSDAECKAGIAYKEASTARRRELLYIAIGRHSAAVMNAYRAGDLVPAAAIEDARAEERERCATLVEGFTSQDHIAFDMKEGRFPCRSVLQDALAIAIRAGGDA